MRRYILLAWVLALVGCGGRENTIVVGSKNFTEQAILGELLAQQIGAQAGLHVERRFYLSGTYVCHQALLAGRIDTYVEYTGTALTTVLKEKPEGDAHEVYDRVRQRYANRFGLVVEPPLGFNDSFAIVIRGEDARRDGLRTISEAVKYAAGWRPGFGYEFMERPDGYAGFIKTYALKFAASPRIMDLGLLYRALLDHQADLVAGNTTDGLLVARDLAVLQDDRHYFPPYQAVPIVRQQTLERYPAVGRALAELAGKISNEDMQTLNYKVDGLHADVATVVREFLKSKGLD